MTSLKIRLKLGQSSVGFYYKSIQAISTFQCLSNSKKPSKYRHTIFEPSSPFFRTVEGKKRSNHEDKMRQLFNSSEAYDLQAKRTSSKKFVLHDGPPYANGKPHMGHAFNKILKDVIVRYKYLKGYKVNFEPGWDCHGLPIELKALEKAKKKGETSGNWNNLSPLQIRNKAKALADETMKEQKEIFDKWGLFLKWSNCYVTSRSSFICKEMELFYKLYQKKLIYQAFLPVHFSPSSKSSLAEAELEYKDDHESPSLYLALPVLDQSKSCLNLATVFPIYLSIWTTTPWSLPSNVAVCINPSKIYILVETRIEGRKVALLWMKDRIEELQLVCDTNIKYITEISGDLIIGLSYVHPINGNPCPVIPGGHVSDLKGTGLVHTAPSHGKEDFLVALKEGLPTNLQLIDGEGYYKEEAGMELKGKFVLSEGNDTVLHLIRSNPSPTPPIIFKLSKIIHSYPYDWRTKKPTIMRASQQWFFDIEKVKDNALKALEDVTIYPEAMRKAFVNSIKSRPYWCLSRQRVWGMPIPVFYDSTTGEPIINSDTISHITSMVQSEGSDVWWKYEEDKLLPPDYVSELKKAGKALPKKGQDIVDIWFDSGSSWFCAMNGMQSDLYIEGYDQITGWFQSSLLISVALHGKAPYKNLIFHGFTIDENMQKMSKSLGNVFDPNIVTHGGKNLSKDPVWGMNVLRWWAMSGNMFSDRRVGPKILTQCQYDVHSVLAVIWYILAWIKDFRPQDLIPYEELRISDKYVLHSAAHSLHKIWNDYETFETKDACYNILDFISQSVGGNYLSSAKDILTCAHRNDHQRLCVQSTLYKLLPFIVYCIAPILPMVAEEAALHSPVKDWTIFHQEPPNLEPPHQWNQPEIALLFEKINQLKLSFLDKISGEGTGTYTKKVLIKYNHDFHKAVRALQRFDSGFHSELCDFLAVSEATLELNTDVPSFSVEIFETNCNQCQRCRKYTVKDNNEICPRCEEVISSIKI